MSEARPPGAAPLTVIHEIPAPSVPWDPYFSIKPLAGYSSLGERFLRGFLTAPDHPLPHFRVGGRVLVRRSDFDRWIEVFRHSTDKDAETIAERILANLDARPRASHARTA